MTTCAALLRGVNVGRAKRVPPAASQTSVAVRARSIRLAAWRKSTELTDSGHRGGITRMSAISL